MPYDQPTHRPWTLDEVHAAFEHRFVDTPYSVTRKGRKIRVEADIADALTLSWVRDHDVPELRGVEILFTKDGTATTRDYSFGLVNTTGGVRRSGQVTYASGRSWSVESSVVFGAGDDGEIERESFTFRTSEIQDPVNEILKRSGWYAGPIGSLSTDAKIGLVVALVTVVGLLVAGLVLVVMLLV